MVIERARIIIGSLLVRIGARLLDEGGPGAPFDDQAEDDDVGIPNIAASTVTEAGRAMIFTDDGVRSVRLELVKKPEVTPK